MKPLCLFFIITITSTACQNSGKEKKNTADDSLITSQSNTLSPTDSITGSKVFISTCAACHKQ